MDLRKLKKLIDLVEESGISELELTEGEEKVRISRSLPHAPAMIQPAHMQHMYAAPPPMPAPAAAAPAEAAEPEIEGHVVKSPMVGTFYRSSSPEAEPLAKVGDVVTPESTVCIIEAMKVMNEIKAEQKGRISKILIENGEAVEFGQSLFEIEPL